MVNMIWMDEASGVCVVTHELFSRPASLVGVVLPLATRKRQWTSGEFKAVVARYEAKLGYELQKEECAPRILSLAEVERLCPVTHVL
jgi:hypothetical protein